MCLIIFSITQAFEYRVLLSIYTASPSREDYVQVRASEKRLIEES